MYSLDYLEMSKIIAIGALISVIALMVSCEIIPSAAEKYGTEIAVKVTVTGKQKYSLWGEDNEVAIRSRNGEFTGTVTLPDKKYERINKGDTITVKVKKLKTPIAVFYSKRE